MTAPPHRGTSSSGPAVSDALLVAALESSADGIVITDSEGIVLWANAAACRMSGGPAGELVGRRLWAEQERDGDPGVGPGKSAWRALAGAAANGWRGVMVLPRESAAAALEEDTVAAIAGGGDSPRAFVVVRHDLSARPPAEVAARDSEASVRHALAASGCAIFEHAIDEPESCLVSARFAEILGLALDEIPPPTELGAWWRAHIHPDDRNETQERFDECVSGRSDGWVATFRMRHRDGDYVHVHVAANAVERDEEGRTRRVVGIVQDVSQQQRALLELKLRNARLKDADRAKNEYLDLVSHDLRTPCATIMGGTSLLLTGKVGELTPRMRRVVEMIERSANQQSRMIDDLLGLAQLEAGVLKPELGRLDLCELCRAVVEDLALVAREREVTIRAETAEEDDQREIWVLADRGRFVQVLTNLITNAIRHARNTVVVRVSCAEDRGQVARIEVEDNGDGVAETELQAIFDRFRRGSDSRNKSGIGLGLAIVRALVDVHNGSVWAENRLGNDGSVIGARFVVVLPLAAPDSAAPA
ncbi:MAG: PAS domain-containing sensor histidine kinase [Candidatus Schekmanbacteria bacterium]|nr:PAS domain-containing sensor histidine kinase [Candidatus Schekmanbacteria bacterium]